METVTVSMICSITFSALGFAVAYLTLNRSRKRDSEEEGQSRGVIASDIGYIKAGVDDLKRESKEQRAAVADLTQRVTRCEESCKQAHKRIDEIRRNEHEQANFDP